MRLRCTSRASALPAKIFAVRLNRLSLTKAANPGIAMICSCSARNCSVLSSSITGACHSTATGSERPRHSTPVASPRRLEGQRQGEEG
jgi:hypothetical protein